MLNARGKIFTIFHFPWPSSKFIFHQKKRVFICDLTVVVEVANPPFRVVHVLR